MTTLKWAAGTLLAVLFAVAIISRLGSDKSIPGTVSAGFSAFTNIFKGAFS